MDKSDRSTRVSVRFSQEELQSIKEEAELSEQTISEYIRNRTVQEPAPAPPDPAIMAVAFESLSSLKDFGSIICNLVKDTDQGDTVRELFEELSKKINALKQWLREQGYTESPQERNKKI